MNKRVTLSPTSTHTNVHTPSTHTNAHTPSTHTNVHTTSTHTNVHTTSTHTNAHTTSTHTNVHTPYHVDGGENLGIAHGQIVVIVPVQRHINAIFNGYNERLEIACNVVKANIWSQG